MAAPEIPSVLGTDRPSEETCQTNSHAAMTNAHIVAADRIRMMHAGSGNQSGPKTPLKPQKPRRPHDTCSHQRQVKRPESDQPEERIARREGHQRTDVRVHDAVEKRVSRSRRRNETG